MPPVLPSVEELRPQLDRLEATPGSVILIAVEKPDAQNFPRVTFGFFDAKERKALRAALTRCRKAREKSAGVSATP